MDKPTCRTCVYAKEYFHNDTHVMCQRRAPGNEKRLVDQFPIVDKDNFCGDHNDFAQYVSLISYAPVTLRGDGGAGLKGTS